MFKYVVILAGGKGTRLGALTRFTSKALVEVNGLPMITYSLRQIKDVENKIITVGYHYDQLVNFVAGFDVFTIINTQNRGNCWWMFNSFIKILDEPVLVLTCDLISQIDLDFLYVQYLKVGCPANMLVPTDPMPQFDGDFLQSEGNRVMEMSMTQKTQLFCTGIQVVNPAKVLKTVNSEKFPEEFGMLWKELIEKGQLCHSDLYPYQWYSINTERELKLYEKISCSV